MEATQLVVTAMVQGLTEFLPISSSAHLILLPYFFDWPDQGFAFDVATHVGTLFAILLYFSKDLLGLGLGFFQARHKNHIESRKLFVYLVIATIPIGLVGLFLKPYVETSLRSPIVIAYSTVVFGLVMLFADRMMQSRTFQTITSRDALAIGCAQVLALIPGASRSGVTMSAGRFKGLTREAAARMAFFMAIPVMVLAAMLELHDLFKSEVVITWRDLAWGAFLAFLSGLACIHLFMKLLPKTGLWPFVLYRLGLGTALFCLLYG